MRAIRETRIDDTVPQFPPKKSATSQAGITCYIKKQRSPYNNLNKDRLKRKESSMNIAPIFVDGWKFEVTDSKLSITSEQNNNLHMQLSAKAALWLLNYLYEERNYLQEAAQQETTEEVEMKKTERRIQSVQDDDGMSDQHVNKL